VSGERPRDRSETGERLVDRRLDSPETLSPPRSPSDPDDPVVRRLGKIAITEPGKSPARTDLDAERLRKLGEIPVRESVELGRTPRPDRQVPPTQRARDDETSRDDRTR
jgi:hypothetical protein